MTNTSKIEVTDSNLYYYRRRNQNRVHEALTAFFAEEAESRGITKRDIAEALHRDPAQISRWLTTPSNLTVDSISDLLLSLGAEMDYVVARFLDRPKANEMHPLISSILHPTPTIEVVRKKTVNAKPFQHLTPLRSTTTDVVLEPA